MSPHSRPMGEDRSAQHGANPATPVRVLVVDDNALNRALATFLLESDGMVVATAVDVPAAMAQIATFAPNLVLMDIQLPGIDGLEGTRRIKADPTLQHIVVIAFTAYAMKGDEQRMLAAGCDGYVSKPIDATSFARQVRASLG